MAISFPVVLALLVADLSQASGSIYIRVLKVNIYTAAYNA